MSQYVAKRADGTTVHKGDVLHNGRGENWTFESVTHPRKVFVSFKNDPNGNDFYPNRESREYYATVFDLGIWDNFAEDWSFRPNWA